MKDKLGNRMKEFEVYKDQKLASRIYFAVRLDGRNFSKFTEKLKFKKPFDDKFKEIMLATALGLTREFKPIITYTQSDEISLIFDKDSNIFLRRIEKLISTTASCASSKFLQSSNLNETIMFDSRIIILPKEENVLEYLQWRQLDAIRNCLNSWAYSVLKEKGISKKKIDNELFKKRSKYKRALLSKYGINFNKIPLWQKRGHLLTWRSYEKEGYNPIKKEKVLAYRKKIIISDKIPIGEKFKSLVQDLFPKT